MNEVEGGVKIVTEVWNRITGMPSHLLLILVLNVIGVLMKLIPQIPNRLIPVLLIVLSTVFYPALVTPGTVNPEFRNPTVVLAIYGFLIGAMAWVAHLLVWKRIGKKLKEMADGADPGQTMLAWILALLLPVIVLTGCATRPPAMTPVEQHQAELDAKVAQAQRLATLAKAAAMTGTALWLREHPADRPHFETARTALNALLTGIITPEAFSAALAGLPVKELKDDDTALIVNSAVILYNGFLAEKVNIDANVYLRPVVTAVRDGIAVGLGMTTPN
jgi:hypothetical protein